MNVHLEAITTLNWQNYYYAKIHSWMPLSKLETLNERYSEDVLTILEKSDIELLRYATYKSITSFIPEPTTLFKDFCFELVLYMKEKNIEFELALKRTHKLKAFQTVIYRKSEITNILQCAIKQYQEYAAIKEKIQLEYSNRVIEEVAELLDLQEQITLSNSPNLIISKNLLTTMLYRQVLSYFPHYDKLIINKEISSKLQKIYDAVIYKENQLWSELS